MSEAIPNNKHRNFKIHRPESHILEIPYIFSMAKKKYKLLKYIDNSYMSILKQDGLSGKFTTTLTEPHELRDALCNTLFRNIVLEIYSIFFDDRTDVLSSYVINTINAIRPGFIEEYNKTKPLLKKYRDKLLAHKATIKKRAEQYGYKHNQLDNLVILSEKIFQ